MTLEIVDTGDMTTENVATTDPAPENVETVIHIEQDWKPGIGMHPAFLVGEIIETRALQDGGTEFCSECPTEELVDIIKKAGFTINKVLRIKSSV